MIADKKNIIQKSANAPNKEKPLDPEKKTNITKNQIEDNSKLPEDYKNLKTVLYKDSVVDKWSTENEQEKPPFLVRMINEDEDILWNYNTHMRLENLNTDKIQKTEIRLETKQRKRKSCCNHISFILLLLASSLLLVFIEFIFFCIGINYYKQCGYIDVYLIISAIFHVIILIIEMIHLFIERVKYHPKFRPFISIFQFLSSILLIGIYIFCVIWYTVGYAWIMVPYTESLNRADKDEVIRVFIGSSEKSITQTFCPKSLFNSAIIYQIYVLCLFLFRIVILGFGRFCKAICAKISSSYNTENTLVTMYERYNEINENLPPITSRQISEFTNQTILPRTLHENSFCMIANHPVWK